MCPPTSLYMLVVPTRGSYRINCICGRGSEGQSKWVPHGKAEDTSDMSCSQRQSICPYRDDAQRCKQTRFGDRGVRPTAD